MTPELGVAPRAPRWASSLVGVRAPGRRIPAIGAAAVIAVGVALTYTAAPAASAATGCRALATPASLGGVLLRLHRAYEAREPDVHNPKITGPVGRVLLGSCGTKRYALASFDATYNGDYFGTEDQPERFIKPLGKGWQDIGNTGGDPCGSAPTPLLQAWKIVRGCPD
jgi:hypothetical protein